MLMATVVVIHGCPLPVGHIFPVQTANFTLGAVGNFLGFLVSFFRGDLPLAIELPSLDLVRTRFS